MFFPKCFPKFKFMLQVWSRQRQKKKLKQVSDIERKENMFCREKNLLALPMSYT